MKKQSTYVVEREFLSKYSVKELLQRIIKIHIKQNLAA